MPVVQRITKALLNYAILLRISIVAKNITQAYK